LDFDESLQDRAGAASDELTGRGGQVRFVSAEEVPSIVGQAVALGVASGDAAYLTAPNTPDLQLESSYTLESWIHPTLVGGWNRLILQWGQSPNYAYHLAIHDGLASIYHGQSNGHYLRAEGGRMVAGRWYHLAAVAGAETRRCA
jgi:hypothetical protein